MLKADAAVKTAVFAPSQPITQQTFKDYPLMSADEMLARAAREEHHSLRCGIVTAGRGIRPEELETVCEAISGFQRFETGALRVLGHFKQ